MNLLNTYIPYDAGTADLEQAFLNDMAAQRRNAELDRIGNTFERISEQLSILHATLNSESGVTNA